MSLTVASTHCPMFIRWKQVCLRPVRPLQRRVAGRKRLFMCRCRVRMSAVLFLAAASVSATASDDWLGGGDLVRECRALSDKWNGSSGEASELTCGNLCAAYLQGFIAGSGRAERSASSTPDPDVETFSERAVRTRVESHVRRYEDSRQRAHCIGEDVPVSDVAEAILEYLDSRSNEPEITASAIVHEALVRRFPCEQP